MNENHSRRSAASETKTEGSGTRRERVRVAITGAVAAALLSTALLGATTALGGSGGVGPGGGGGDSTRAGKYAKEWRSFSHKDKAWARKTSECESGGSTHIHGGGGSYHGAFQYTLSTWRHAPMSPGGDPHTRDWKTQAVVAVKMKHRDGAGAWPVCG